MLGLLGVGPLRPFFPLTSNFFGLTSDYKIPLLEEIYVCMKYLHIPYNDVLSMPTYERRFYLTMFTSENEKRAEKMEEMKSTNKSGKKGHRISRITGNQLKNKLKSGE